MRPVPSTLEPRRRAERAFTLVEVLLVLALLALGGAILLPAVGTIVGSKRPESTADAVAIALQSARRDAVLTGRELALRFEPEAQRLAWAESTADLGSGGPRIRVDFLRPAAGSAVLIGGRVVETSAVPALRFFPDGTCDPVRVQIRVGEETARILTIDPWTCAPGLEAKL